MMVCETCQNSLCQPCGRGHLTVIVGCCLLMPFCAEMKRLPSSIKFLDICSTNVSIHGMTLVNLLNIHTHLAGLSFLPSEIQHLTIVRYTITGLERTLNSMLPKTLKVIMKNCHNLINFNFGGACSRNLLLWEDMTCTI
jgi:hypothetical protein